MERLYDKFSRRPWTETAKLVHFCMDKPRVTSTATSDSPITYCLQKIERTLDARNLSAVMNKLESLAKELALESYMSHSGTTFYIATDTFYIEVHLENNGAVKDVMLAHPAKSFLTCDVLLHRLRMQNYDAFGEFLEELLHLYRIPGDSCTRFKGHAALFYLEQDLHSISIVHKIPEMDRVVEILCGKVGYVRPRTEGIPMSLEFYMSPYQILEEELNPGLELTGMKVFVTMGLADKINKLVLCPLLERTVRPGDPIHFIPLSAAETVDLQACFYLMFQQPFPMSLSRLDELHQHTGILVAGIIPAHLDELIIQLALPEKSKDDQTMRNYFYVSLPDIPQEIIFINIGPENPGAMVNSIPFVYWMYVPDIIEILRCQATYNTLISSCISACTKCEDSSNLLYLEVSAQNGTRITVTFQHPLSHNTACVVLNILNPREPGSTVYSASNDPDVSCTYDYINRVKCTLHTVANDPDLNCSNDYLTRIIDQSMSIPVLMRAIFKKATETIQIMEETSEQNPHENKAAPSSMRSLGDYGASISPEGSRSETSRQTGENASVEPSGDDIKENASPELLGDGVEAGASVGPSSADKEGRVSMQPTGDKIDDELFLTMLELAEEETVPPVTSPLSRLEDYYMDHLFSP